MNGLNHNEERERQLRLKAMLREDTGEEDNEVYLPTLLQLSEWQAPKISQKSTESLIDKLAAELPKETVKHTSWWNSWGILLIRSQFRVVQREIWIASTFVMLLGMIVTLAMIGANNSVSTLPFVLVAPLVTAVGIAFIYGDESEPALEIVMATKASQRLLVLARLVIVFGFDLTLALLCSVVIVLAGGGLALLPMITSWLVPMLFLSGLAFFLSVLWFDSLIGVFVSLVLWVVVSANHLIKLNNTNWILPTLLDSGAYQWLWLPALLFVAGGLWLTGNEERGLTKGG
jgi:hypothetical protein